MKNLKKAFFAAAVLIIIFLFANVSDVHAQRNRDRNRGDRNGEMTWRGTVDDIIQIRIRNRNAQTRHIRGRAYNDADYNFDGRMPQDNVNVRVDKKDGRGRVFIVQQPNRRNNYTTIVQIEDPKGGADRYRFQLKWN